MQFVQAPHAPVREDWLASHCEPVLFPDIPIIDAHHHLWHRQSGRYLAEEFANDISSGHRIVSTVYVQCRSMLRTGGPVAMQPLGEVEFANGVAAMFASGGYRDWKRALTRLATLPNTRMKLGGGGMTVLGHGFAAGERPPTSEALAVTWRPYFEACVELFGANRCMFESNFPVDKGSFSYAVLWNAFKRLASEASADERDAFFSKVAAATYRMAIPGDMK